MQKFVKKFGALCLGIILAGTAAPASAAYPLNIGGGPGTGAYLPFANAICGTALGTLFNCTALETKGAQANMDMLNAGTVDMAVLKGNLAMTLMQDPASKGKFTLVRTILPGEAVMAIMTPKTAAAVANWSGIRDNAFLLRFGLPGAKSGDASVFNDLRAVENSPLKDAAGIDVLPGRPELIEAIKAGKTQVGFVVQLPDPGNPFFKQVSDAGLVIMGVVDPDFITVADFTIGEATVTNASRTKGAAAKSIQTTMIPPAIIARDTGTYTDITARKTMEAAIRKIKAVNVADLLPKADWATAMLNKASQAVAGIKVADLYSSMKAQAIGAADRIKAELN